MTRHSMHTGAKAKIVSEQMVCEFLPCQSWLRRAGDRRRHVCMPPRGRTHFPEHAGPCARHVWLLLLKVGDDREEEMEEVTLPVSRAGVG